MYGIFNKLILPIDWWDQKVDMVCLQNITAIHPSESNAYGQPFATKRSKTFLLLRLISTTNQSVRFCVGVWHHICTLTTLNRHNFGFQLPNSPRKPHCVRLWMCVCAMYTQEEMKMGDRYGFHSNINFRVFSKQEIGGGGEKERGIPINEIIQFNLDGNIMNE